MTAHIELERKASQEIFQREYQGKEVLQVVFAGFEQGIPVVSFRSFVAETLPSGAIYFHLAQQQDCPGDCTKDVRAHYLGENAVILAHMSQTPPALGTDRTLAGIANFLVQLEIADKPNTVGLPIDILRLSNKGPDWVQRKLQCKQ